MSALYEMEVVDRRETEVDIRLRVVHPDVPSFPVARNFAMQLLLKLGPDSPLERAVLRELAVEEMFDWHGRDLTTISYRYVPAVRIIQTRNLPSAHDGDGTVGIWWDRSGEGHVNAEAIYRVSVRHPDWCEHVTPGTRDSSAAFDESNGEENDRPFGVELIGMERDTVDLRVHRLSDAVYPIATHALFAFQLLLERAQIAPNPGGFDFTEDQLADDGLLRELAPSYVRSVERRDEGGRDARSAVLRVTLADTRWLAHLEPTMAWLSFGFTA